MTIVETIIEAMGKSAPSKPKLDSRTEDAGNGTKTVIATRVMIVRFEGTTPKSMDPQKDEENLAPAAQTDVDHLPHPKGETEDVPENLGAGEKDQVNDEAPLPDPVKDEERGSLEVHQLGAIVLRHHPNEGGLEEALEGFPVADPDLNRQGGAQRPPTHHQQGLRVQEANFPLEPLLPERKEDQVAGISWPENAPEEICAIFGTHKLAKIG